MRWDRSHTALERGHLPKEFCVREGSGVGSEGGDQSKNMKCEDEGASGII